MENNFFYKSIHRCNRNFLIFNILFSIILIVTIITHIVQGVFNVLFGPFKLDNYSIENIQSLNIYRDYAYNPELYYIKERTPLNYNYYVLNNKFYFTVSGERVYDSNVVYVITRSISADSMRIANGQYIDANYLLLQLNDKYLIVKAPKDMIMKTYSGIIVPLLPSIRKEIIDNNSNILSDNDLVPVMLNAVDEFKPDIYTNIIICVIFIVLNLINYARIIYRNIDIHNNPTYQHIGRYGIREEVIESINKEVSGIQISRNFMKTIVTPNWIVKKGLFRLRIKKNHMQK